MASFSPSPSSDSAASLAGLSRQALEQLPADSNIWQDLKSAIAESSGFQSWQLERSAQGSLDARVRLYLRETLETLAY